MKQYREKVVISTIFTAIACIILSVFVLLGFLNEAGLISFLTPIDGDSHWHSMWRGFLSGASCGILLLMVLSLVQSILALNDEKRLKNCM